MFCPLTMFLLAGFLRWMNTNIILATISRTFFDSITFGRFAPFTMHLSDGGHIENLGLLPVLQRQADRIIIADGTLYGDKRLIASDLLRALEMAREWLGCSFTTVPRPSKGGHESQRARAQENKYNYGDLEYDITERFVGLGFKKRQPYAYRFLVHYKPEKEMSLRRRSEREGEDELVARKTGEIIILQPRHPDDHVGVKLCDAGDDSVEPCAVCERTPEWNRERADDLTGCCFTACTGHCHSLSHSILGRYPYFSTANQVLTPEAFEVLHQDGLRAASHKEMDQFLDECLQLTSGLTGSQL